MPRILSLMFALAAVLLLQACSAVRFSYQNADDLLRWWLDRYVDMSPEQDALARERLARFHAWHRKTQLPDYIVLAGQAQGVLTGKPTVADAQALVEGISRRGRTLAEQALPDVADFLSTLAPEQIERMAGRMAKNDADHAKEVRLADGETAQRKAQLKRILERSEYWYGDFSAEQQRAVKRLLDARPTGTQFWFDERSRRQREWLELARLVQREHPPRERILRLLREYVERFELPQDPERLREERMLRLSSAEVFVAIQAMTTVEQRAHAERKLQELIGDLSAVLRERGAAPVATPAGR